jgi:uncharacterized alpha-E superfamily protein
VIECLLFDAALPRSARFAVNTALDSVFGIDGPGRRASRPRRLLGKLKAQFDEADPRQVVENPREFDAQCQGVLRQLEVALRETYFHPSKVPSSVMGEEGRAMPQQQQQRRQHR